MSAMFHAIPQEIQEQMLRLETLDARDRTDGTPRMQRLRQIPPETGRFLCLLAAAAPSGTFIEIGTSAGYSALYLALACREIGARIITFEFSAEKVRQAEETFRLAGVGDVVELVRGDARQYLDGYTDISFCFLDAEKESYPECYELAVENMVPGGFLVADNVISHEQILRPLIDRATIDDRVDSMIIPLGKGLLLCRRN